MSLRAESFSERLRALAAEHPDRVALEGSGSTPVTFAELVARASALGAHLRSLGAGPERIVGLCFEKSPDYVVALLGVWFAGAAFVPLDGKLPAARLGFMARDCGLALVIVQPGLESRLVEAGVSVPLVRLSEVPAEPAAGSVTDVETRPEDLAYVIYTSGTTGMPKGVKVPHRGLVNLLDAQVEAFELDASSRALLYLSTSFDASLSDIGTALLAGATLCIEPEHALQPGPGLVTLLAERRISHVDLPPALLRVLEPESMPATLRTLIIGGEACPPDVVRRWARRFRVINVYGPTEATICTSLCVCDADSWSRPLLGQPIPNVSWRVLDAQRRPVPAGASGELYIGGVGLARGYVNRPELTASRFVELGGERLYRTGDRVMAHPDGEVEFLGRVDRQVKLRGLLIEPEEVESQLLRHPAIQDAAVLKRESPLALVAFIVPRPGANEPMTPEALRAWLSRSLPRWMLPQRYELLEALPRTVTGKVDFDALAQRTLSSRRLSEGFVPPSTEPERRLCALWERVLGLEPVGVTDDFFALGGDSLGVLQVVAAAEGLGIPLSPAALLRHPTVAELLHGAGAEPEDEGMSAESLRADVALGPEWQALLLAAKERPADAVAGDRGQGAILLTGATGFLGARLLHELLRRTDARLICLVRARSDEEARGRVLRALEGQGTPASPPEAERLRALRAELSQPRFGLDEGTWARLTREVGCIYHGAARVSGVQPYPALRATNVGGTEQVLRLMAEGVRKRLHYLSTLSVFVSTDRHTGRMEETDTLTGTRRVYGGYAQSKWAAEVLLRSAGGAAGPVAYYRLGLLTGDSRTGQSASTDFLSLFFRGLATLGCVPEGAGEGLAVDMTPIDYAAAAVAWLSLHAVAPESSRTFHLANARSSRLSELVQALRTFGIPLESVDEAAWRAKRASLALGDMEPAEAAATLALCRCLSPEAFERHRTMDLFQATGAHFGMEGTLGALEGSGLACPPPTEVLLHRYLRYTFGGERGAGPRGEHGA